MGKRKSKLIRDKKMFRPEKLFQAVMGLFKKKGGDSLKVWPKDIPCTGEKWSEFIKAKMKESGCKAGRRPFTKEQRTAHRIAMKNFWHKRHKMLREIEEKLIEEIE